MIIKRITMLMVMIAAAAVLLVPKVSAYDDISLVEKCGTHYGYDYLANCTNPQGRQKLYNDMYKRACEVWQSDYDIHMRSDGSLPQPKSLEGMAKHSFLRAPTAPSDRGKQLWEWCLHSTGV